MNSFAWRAGAMLAGAMAVTLSLAQPGLAAGPGNGGSNGQIGPLSNSVAVPGPTASPNDIVDCGIYAHDPVRLSAQNVVKGTGGISSCVPHDPAVCKTSVDVEEYDLGSWFSRGEATRYGPPCGQTSVTQSSNCPQSNTSHKFRTLTIVAITEDGDYSTSHSYSGTVYFSCL